MTAAHPASPIYGADKPPRSNGGVTLAELMQACCRANWLCGEEMLEAMLRNDGTGPVAGAQDAMRGIGDMAIDGRIRTWARPFGGGAVIPLPPAMWEIDDFEPRVRSSALNLERWADRDAEPTHWIFVDAGDADAVAAKLRAEFDDCEPASTPPDQIPATPAVVGPVPTGASAPSPPAAAEQSERPSAARARRFLKIADVVAATKLSKTRIYEKMKLGTFPDSVRMGSRATAWYDDEVQDWIEQPR